MKSLLILICALAQAKAVKPQEGPAPRPDKASLKPKLKEGAVDVKVRFGAEFGIDDNILELNEKQIEQLEGGTRPEKFRIDEPGDLVYSVWADLRLEGRLFRDPTSAGFKIQPYLYQDSSIANFEEYSFFLRQDIGRQEAGIEIDFQRDVYLRELEIVVPGPNLWESAYYDEFEFELYYRHRIHERATLKGSLGWLLRDFDSPFGHRDRGGAFLALQPTVELGRGWRTFVRYEFTRQEADASGFDPDTSYEQQEVELGAAVELLEKKLDLSLRLRFGLRDYTSSNDPAVDPSHVDRVDDRFRLVFETKFKIAKGWTIDGRWEYRDVDSDRPHDDDATTSEPGDSTRNVFVLGVTFSL